jgi:hypothetical protein
MSQSERDNELIAHYHKHLGLEVRSIRFGERPAPRPGSITVLEFAPPNPDFDWVYVTVGASRKPMPDPESSARHPTGRRFELIMLSDERQDALPDTLEALAAYPFVLNTLFTAGDIVRGSPGEGVLPGSPLTEILLTHPYFDKPEFETIQHKDGSHTHILWLIPIYISERLYAREHSSRTLEVLFGQNDTDTSDMMRPPVV